MKLDPAGLSLAGLSLTGLSPAAAANETPEAKRIGKIHDAAQQFEALMITQMMKAARETESDGWLSDGGETGESSAMDMAEAQFAQAMAGHGGLGLAKMIVDKMSASTAPSSANAAVGSDPSINATESRP